MGKLLLDSELITNACIDAQKFAISAEAEKSLVQLLDIKEKIDEFVETVKDGIVKEALKFDPNFTSISGDKIKLEYRETGSKFALVDNETVEGRFVTMAERMSVKTDEVEQYWQQHGVLPAGITCKERKKTLIIKRKDK